MVRFRRIDTRLDFTPGLLPRLFCAHLSRTEHLTTSFFFPCNVFLSLRRNGQSIFPINQTHRATTLHYYRMREGSTRRTYTTASIIIAKGLGCVCSTESWESVTTIFYSPTARFWQCICFPVISITAVWEFLLDRAFHFGSRTPWRVYLFMVMGRSRESR